MQILATGMVSPVGYTAEAACAAMRAGISKFDELPYVHSTGETIVGSAVVGLHHDFEDEARINELLVGALQDCLADVPDLNVGRIPLLIGLAESGRPGGCAERADSILAELLEGRPWHFDPQRSRVIRTGHTACLEALAIARTLLQQPYTPACLVCGVDSYLNARSLRWLDEERRLKTNENSDGVIPGECAGALLLGKDDTVAGKRSAAVIGLGFSVEKATCLSTEPLLGVGLTEATRTALAEAGLGLHEIDFRLSDLTGESYGFKEQALVVSKLLRARKEELPMWHCAEFIGDIGAAAGVAQLVIAREAFSKGYAPGDTALCCTSAIHGARSAAVVRWG